MAHKMLCEHQLWTVPWKCGVIQTSGCALHFHGPLTHMCSISASFRLLFKASFLLQCLSVKIQHTFSAWFVFSAFYILKLNENFLKISSNRVFLFVDVSGTWYYFSFFLRVLHLNTWLWKQCPFVSPKVTSLSKLLWCFTRDKTGMLKK